MGNHGGLAPSWKKSGIAPSIDYYLYWYVEYFRITSDANKKAGISSHIATCLAPSNGPDGYHDPDNVNNGGDCIDDQWHYQYIDATNVWRDTYVDASVTMGSCTDSSYDSCPGLENQ